MLRRVLVLLALLGGAAALPAAPHTVRSAGTSTVSSYRATAPRVAPPVRFHGYGSDGPERPWAGHHDSTHQPTHSGPAHGHGERPWWNVGAGVFNVPERDGIDAFRAEYRSTRPIFGAGRWLGGVTLGPKDFLLPYAGFYWNLPLDDRFTFTPATSFGFLSGGDETRFGGTLQFRTSFELSYALGRDQRLGFAVQHVSNAQLDQPNKGCNTQLLTYSVAMGP